MKKVLWIAAIVMFALVACNYTEGQCWIDDQEAGSVGAGGGPIFPGTGGFGDVPPQPQDADGETLPKCNEEPEEPQEQGTIICATPGTSCALQCQAAGVFCNYVIEHTVKKGEFGVLFQCCACLGQKKCWYLFDDGSKCIYSVENGTKLCDVK